MLARSTIDRIIPILRKDCRRALRMRVEGFPKAFYCGLVLRDTHWFNTWAGSGSVYRRRSDRKRNVYCDIRVGKASYDQVTNGGLDEYDDELDSNNYVQVPIDDRVYDGLRLSIWRLTEAKFREALTNFNTKETLRISKVDPTSEFKSFTPLPPITTIKHQAPENVDEDEWVKFCKRMSLWMSELPQISSSIVEFDATQETKIFVNSENRIIVQHQKVFSLIATLRRLTKEGAHLEQEVIINTATLKELPDVRKFKRLVKDKYERLLKLVRAKRIHAFSGPVLLYPGPAGLLFHEAIGHRLEGSRLLSTGEGQTFRGQIGKRILNVDLSIRDNPKLKTFAGVKCVGAYDFDDEGTPAKSTLLVEDGVLKEFLNTRAPLSTAGFVPNGHARNSKHQRPISRMGVTVIDGKRTQSIEGLKKLLIRELHKQKKPYGLIVYDTTGGETETTSYDFQAFSGEISFATLIYPDGREEVVRGVDFVGTPLQALSNIIAIGDTLELDNSFCGAESGMIPVTTISPAILLSSLELQAKEEELVTQYILPKPKLRH